MIKILENFTTVELQKKFTSAVNGGQKRIEAGLLTRDEFETDMQQFEDELHQRGVDF